MKKEETWNYKGFLKKMKRHELQSDGAYEQAMSELKKRGGPLWTDKLCQADILSIIIAAARKWDAKYGFPRRK